MEVFLDGIYAGPNREGVTVNVGRLVMWIDGDRLRIWGDSAGGQPLLEIDLEGLQESYEALPGLVRLAEEKGWTAQGLRGLVEVDADADGVGDIEGVLWWAMRNGDDPAWLEEMIKDWRPS